MLLITNHDFYNKQDTTTFSRRTDSGPQQNGLQLNRRAHINIFFCFNFNEQCEQFVFKHVNV